jgi:hypothetical protein
LGVQVGKLESEQMSNTQYHDAYFWILGYIGFGFSLQGLAP